MNRTKTWLIILASTVALLTLTAGCTHQSPYASASVAYTASTAPPARVYYNGSYLHYRNDGYYAYRGGSWYRAPAVPSYVHRYHYRSYSRPVYRGTTYYGRRTYHRPTTHRHYSRPPSHHHSRPTHRPARPASPSHSPSRRVYRY